MQKAFDRFRFVMRLTCLAALQSAMGASLTGTFYGDQGGVSGTATGDIRLAVNGEVYRLAYQKPYPAVFSSESCGSAGSTWTVEVAEIDDLGEGALASAQCKGDGDSLGLPAVQLVSQYLNSIRSQEYRTAYELFAAAYKSRHPFSEFAAESEVLDFGMYLSAGRCLEIVRKTSDTHVLVRAESQCLIGKKRERAPLSFVFNVVREPSSNTLRIENVLQISEHPRMVRRFPSEKTRDESIERAVLKALRMAPNNYYFYDRVDLDGDGEPEVLVYTVSHDQCDFNGCNLLVMKKKGEKYEAVSNITQSWMPVFVSSKRTNGWNDLIVSTEGNYYTVLKFDGKSYPRDPRSQPPLSELVDGTAYLSNPRNPAYGVSLMRDQLRRHQKWRARASTARIAKTPTAAEGYAPASFVTTAEVAAALKEQPPNTQTFKSSRPLTKWIQGFDSDPGVPKPGVEDTALSHERVTEVY
jgi:hypothetical protein